MSLTPTAGEKLALQMAITNAGIYRRANQQYGSLLAEYGEDFPKSFALGHLTRVNPSMNPTPIPSSDQRRGFMFAPVDTLASINVKWGSLDDPTTCAYVWGYDINLYSRQLYTNNVTLFTEPSTDFWRCVYLRHVLGGVPFGVIWAARNRTSPTVYGGLLYAVNNLTRHIPGWSIIKLKRTVFVDCAYSYELSKQSGTLLTEGFGRSPVLAKQNMTEVFK